MSWRECAADLAIFDIDWLYARHSRALAILTIGERRAFVEAVKANPRAAAQSDEVDKARRAFASAMMDARARDRAATLAKRPSGLDRALGRKSKPVPQHTRLLKPEEARKIGVSLTAKRRVRADIKRVTKRTRLYTDREVATAKIRRSTGSPRATRETYARERKARAQTETLIVMQPGGTLR